MFNRQQSITRARAVDLSSTDDTMPANSPTRAVFVGTGGTLIVELAGAPGVSVTYKVQSGTRQQISVSKFIKSGTTAADIVAEF
ncbi:hypothetical protein [Mesorhizobium sp. BR-1-1-10]|uniref:spike base protein, RCAP_Rcc01079 family n=1 Tax=Mesorhizobium sp. BR-1-1-10 TaxID=2876660 RepID=UPI001CD13559|nr:hypothetical protein [Mesorhizobium sp. BR-1-1-10]MBZ9975472.1 hypothetical protein [Mesorhizobium sp. BR-1-1-10]